MSRSPGATIVARAAAPLLGLLGTVGLIALPACRPAPAPPAEPALATFADAILPDQRTLRLTVAASAATIRTTDRLTVTLTIDRPADVPAELLDPASGLPGWTVVEGPRTDRATLLPDGSLRVPTTIVVEPFLDGSYTLGPFKAQLIPTTNSAANANTPEPSPIAQTDPLTVRVISVLDDPSITDPSPDTTTSPAEPAALAGPRDLPPPPPEPGSLKPWLIAGIAVTATASGAVVFVAFKRRRPTAPRPPSPEALLREIEREPDDARALDLAAAAVRQLMERHAAPHAAAAPLAALLERLDTARFSGHTAGGRQLALTTLTTALDLARAEAHTEARA